MRILTPLFKKFATALGIPQLQQRLDETQAGLYAYMDEANPRIDKLEFDVRDTASLARDAEAISQLAETRSNDFTMNIVIRAQEDLTNVIRHAREDLTFHVDQKQIQMNQSVDQLRDVLTTTESRLEDALAKVRLNLDSIRRTQSQGPSSTALAPEQSRRAPQRNAPPDDSLYVSLEDQFRGDRDVVKDRQANYLGHLGDSVSKEHPLVDLGCGRGEWLRLLADRGIPSRGVDGNIVCVAECTEAGLDVVHDDLLAHLEGLPDASIGAVTLFQVFEHLPFGVLLDTLRQIRRVLVPSGVLIAEIPNSKNLRVGASTFWIDPTHERPLFPDVLLFLASQVGFRSVDGLYVNRLGPVHDYAQLPDSMRAPIESVVEAIDGPGDFALVAHS